MVNWGMIGGLIVGFLFIAVISWTIIEDTKTILDTRYKMPNGVICKHSDITGGGFGGATNEFSGCSDGKRYINPETYSKHKTKYKSTLRDVLLGADE